MSGFLLYKINYSTNFCEWIVCYHAIVLPNGNRVPMAILKCCIPNGIPIIVAHKHNPKVKWLNAISHHPIKIHRILNAILMHPPLLGPATRSCPKGNNTNLPILNNCTPNGIPTIVRHIIKPTIQ